MYISLLKFVIILSDVKTQVEVMDNNCLLVDDVLEKDSGMVGNVSSGSSIWSHSEEIYRSALTDERAKRQAQNDAERKQHEETMSDLEREYNDELMKKAHEYAIFSCDVDDKLMRNTFRMKEDHRRKRIEALKRKSPQELRVLFDRVVTDLDSDDDAIVKKAKQ